MAQVTVVVNQRTYSVACDDGEEEHLRDLARYVDAQIAQVAKGVGQIGEARLLLMGALMIADQLAEADERVEKLETRLAAKPAEGAEQGGELAQMLDRATRRIEALAARLEGA